MGEPPIWLDDACEWGIKVNFAEPRSAVRTGALGWVIDRNIGWGGERIRVLARSRGGRLIDTWIATKRLTNCRASWMPDHLRDRCFARFPTREEAEAVARGLSKHSAVA